MRQTCPTVADRVCREKHSAAWSVTAGALNYLCFAVIGDLRSACGHIRQSGQLAYLSLNFDLIRFTVSETVRFLYLGILSWNYPFTPTFTGFWGILSPNNIIYRYNPEKEPPCGNTWFEPWGITRAHQQMRYPNVTWRIILYGYLFTTELRHTYTIDSI